jgi:hypothetical protein
MKVEAENTLKRLQQVAYQWGVMFQNTMIFKTTDLRREQWKFKLSDVSSDASDIRKFHVKT